jgi:hypothetical protein
MRKPLQDTNCTPSPSCTAAVLCLSPDVLEEDLKHFGERFGRVVAVRLVRHKETGVSRQYGFIQFSYERELIKAIRDCTDPTQPRPRIRGKIVVLEAERGRTDPSFVPQRFRVVAQQRDVAHRQGGAVSSLGGDAKAAPTAFSPDDILDNIDDYLAGL